MARTKKIKPVGDLRPLYPFDPKGLQVDEDGNLFNSKGTRRGMANTKTPAVEIAHKHNWDLLIIKGAVGNLRRLVYGLTPTEDELERNMRNSLSTLFESLETTLNTRVEVSREQAKKNLKD